LKAPKGRDSKAMAQHVGNVKLVSPEKKWLRLLFEFLSGEPPLYSMCKLQKNLAIADCCFSIVFTLLADYKLRVSDNAMCNSTFLFISSKQSEKLLLLIGMMFEILTADFKSTVLNRL
jgi:hypothetical protein